MGLRCYIDPSFSGTGIFTVDPVRRFGLFYLIGRPEVKKSLEAYFIQADDIAERVSQVVYKAGASHPDGKTDIYMEAPFIRGFSSEGLHMLQAMLLKKFQHFYFDSTVWPREIHSITAAFIKGAVSREFKRRSLPEPKQKIKARQLLGRLVLSELKQDGWSFEHEEVCYQSTSDDALTAFFFWYLSCVREIKEFPLLKLHIRDYDENK